MFSGIVASRFISYVCKFFVISEFVTLMFLESITAIVSVVLNLLMVALLYRFARS